LGTLFHLARQHGYVPDAAASWKRDLITTRSGEPTENVTNVCLWLTHDETWQGRFWWDAVANVPMCDDAVVGDQLVTDIAHWLGQQARIPIRSLRLVERCITAVCQQTARDPIVEWLDALPPWDGIERLESWLEDVAEAPGSAYGRAVSRLIPVSMVARAKAPGCLYRYVVILEGPEESGKSSLVRALGQRWYANMSMMLESKESHMAIQGVWVAELTELDSLTRSEENRIKSFLTMTQDDYVPKYSNTRVKYPRRTVFVGTTNEQEYLKGLSGNTRFLPIPTRAIDVDLFEAMREQLFAEALVYVATHPQQWWDVPTAVKIEASLERDVRRHTNEYEERIAEWLLPLVAQGKQRVSWPEIAEQVLKITSPEAWKDTRLLAQVRAAMRALGWVRKPVRDGLITRRLWIKADSS
jgi:putative DNA primase/helicase